MWMFPFIETGLGRRSLRPFSTRVPCKVCFLMLLPVSFYTTDIVWGFPKWTSVITAREKNLYDRVWVRIFFPPFNSAAYPAEAVKAFSTLRYGWLHLVAMEQPEDCNYVTDWGSVMRGQLTQKPRCMSQSACGLWDVDGQSGRLTSGCPGGWDCLRGLTHGHPSSTVSSVAALHVWSQSSTVIPLYTGIPLAVSEKLLVFPFTPYSSHG